MRKHGLKGLGLALIAALGLMAFGASAAQAVELEPGFWLKENGTKITKETISGEQAAMGTLELPSKNAAILCEKGVLENAEIDNETKVKYKKNREGAEIEGLTGHGRATLLFLECKVYNLTGGVIGTELKACTEALDAPLVGKPENRHITATALLLVERHGGLIYVIAEPLAGSEFFVKLKFNPATCSLPEEVNIKGSVGCELNKAADEVTQTLALDTLTATGKCGSNVQTLLGTGLKFGANAAQISGSGTAAMNGGAKGKAFGAM